MLGATLLTVALIIWFVRAGQQRLLLAILLGLSIVTQVLVVNRYRLDWNDQNSYYWQLAWRVPALTSTDCRPLARAALCLHSRLRRELCA